MSINSLTSRCAALRLLTLMLVSQQCLANPQQTAASDPTFDKIRPDAFESGYQMSQDVPMAAPANVRGGGGRTGVLAIMWDPLALRDRNAPGIRYVVYWRRVGLDEELEFNKKETDKHDFTPMMFVPIDGLKYFYTDYEVKVQALNDMGAGPTSEPVLVKSAEAPPKAVPAHVTARAYNSTAINVTWHPIEMTRDNIRGKLRGYYIRYWRRKIDEVVDSTSILNFGTGTHVTVVGLIPNTLYCVRGMAYNGAGNGPASKLFLVRTWRYRPLTPPNDVRARPINPSTVRVRWRGINTSNIEEPLMGYKVKVWEIGQDMTTANETSVRIGQALDVNISTLTPGKAYALRVMGFSRGGDGKLSSPAFEFEMGGGALGLEELTMGLGVSVLVGLLVALC